MEVIDISKKSTIVNDYIRQLRDINIQKDRWRFKQNLRRIARYCAYAISEDLEYNALKVKTPLGVAEARTLTHQPVIASVLRAGLTMHEGILDVFDEADNAFIAAMRKHKDDGSFFIDLNYMASPDLHDRIVILGDPMLATGASMITAVEAMKKSGIPKFIHIVSAIASREGVEYVNDHLDIPAKLWVAAIDDTLTAEAYISPGLGDAGDLAYGEKHEH